MLIYRTPIFSFFILEDIHSTIKTILKSRVDTKPWRYRLFLNNTNANAILSNIAQLQYNTIQCNMLKYCRVDTCLTVSITTWWTFSLACLFWRVGDQSNRVGRSPVGEGRWRSPSRWRERVLQGRWRERPWPRPPRNPTCSERSKDPSTRSKTFRILTRRRPWEMQKGGEGGVNQGM